MCLGGASLAQTVRETFAPFGVSIGMQAAKPSQRHVPPYVLLAALHEFLHEICRASLKHLAVIEYLTEGRSKIPIEGLAAA